MYIHSLGKLVTVISYSRRAQTHARQIRFSPRGSRPALRTRQRGSSHIGMYARSRAGPARDRTHRPSPTAARGHRVRDTTATRSPSRGSGRSAVFAASHCSNTHRLHTRRTDTCTPDGHAGPRARLQKSQRKEVRLDTPARTCAGCFRSRVKKRCLDHARFVPTCMSV